MRKFHISFLSAEHITPTEATKFNQRNKRRSRYTGLAINNNLGAFNIFILKGIS